MKWKSTFQMEMYYSCQTVLENVEVLVFKLEVSMTDGKSIFIPWSG